MLLVLGAAMVAGLFTWGAVFWLQMQTPPEVWMGRKLGLEGAALEKFTTAHSQYSASCLDYCLRIQKSDRELKNLILSSSTMTPEIAKAMARSDALRHECRQNMLRHFYEVAEMLEPSKQQIYLDMVLPLIVEPGLMSQQHHHP